MLRRFFLDKLPGFSGKLAESASNDCEISDDTLQQGRISLPIDPYCSLRPKGEGSGMRDNNEGVLLPGQSKRSNPLPHPLSTPPRSPLKGRKWKRGASPHPWTLSALLNLPYRGKVAEDSLTSFGDGLEMSSDALQDDRYSLQIDYYQSANQRPLPRLGD